MNPIVNNSGFYNEIKSLIVQSRFKIYQTVNFAMVQTYWQIGKRIVEEEQAGSTRAGYGESLIDMLSERLTTDFGKGFSRRNVFYMRSLYVSFPIVHALRAQLSWTHYRLILQIDNQKEREYYLNEAAKEHWSTRQLERQIQTNWYQRVLSTKPEVETPAKQEPESFNPADFIKDPYILEFLDLKPYTPYLEKELEQAILNRLQDFLLELGKGFCFVARQKHISTEQNRHYHIDLVFYNYLLRCFVLVDLKIGTLTAEDVGKMDMYVRMYEDQFKPADDNPTLGIILCPQTDETVVKYSLLNDRKQLFASQYRLVVPSEKALAKVVDDEIQHIKNENILQEKLMHYGKL
jgi:predicted nuclease of restriction endonuclease-like (RecB) superfamily